MDDKFKYESTTPTPPVNGLEEPSNKFFAGKCDNYNINYSGKSATITQNSNYDSMSWLFG